MAGTGRPRVDRAAVLEAACRVTDRDGMDGLTLASVAAELGLHSSSLYNHVDGLEGLRKSVTVAALEELSERLRDAVLGRGGAAGMRAIADAYRAYAAERPGRFRAATSWHLRCGWDEVQDATDGGLRAIHAVISSFGLEGVALRHAARAYTSALIGFIQAADHAFTGPPSAEGTFDYLVSLFSDAFASGRWPSSFDGRGTLDGHGATSG
jgi:AcrR family transcriptional regulator